MKPKDVDKAIKAELKAEAMRKSAKVQADQKKLDRILARARGKSNK